MNGAKLFFVAVSAIFAACLFCLLVIYAAMWALNATLLATGGSEIAAGIVSLLLTSILIAGAMFGFAYLTSKE
jgi:hypothetical protein